MDSNGNNPGIIKASVRLLLRLIEVNPILFGGFVAGIVVNVSEKGQRWGDMLAGTYVIASEHHLKLKDEIQGYGTKWRFI